MVACLLRLGMLLGIYLANFSQVQAAGAPSIVPGGGEEQRGMAADHGGERGSAGDSRPAG